MFKKAIATAAATSALLLATVIGAGVGTATAATSPVATGYGFDGNAHLIVGGGSTTIYKLTQSLASLWDETASCATNNSNFDGAPSTYPPTSAVFNQCSPSAQTYSGTNAGGNYDGDTVTVAAPTGSSDGIASLNSDFFKSGVNSPGTQAYEGTNGTITGDNGYGTVDFALSSRAAKLTGGNCAATGPNGNTNDEEACDTFWGIAADGVEVFTWTTTSFGASDGLTAQDLFGIFNCQFTTWGSLPDYASDVAAGATLPASGDPIVPWSMNSGSGTFADFDNYIAANATGVPSGWTVNNSCEKQLTGSNPLPLENDTKPLLQDVQTNQGGLSTNPASANDPANWIWFGSYALLHNYSFLSSPLQFGTTYNTNPVPVNGTVPSVSDIHAGTYPIPRVVSLVTAKADANCPAATGGGCNFTGNAGPTNGNNTTDLNVTGASTGKGGAVREFVRFLCRNKAQSAIPGTTQLSPADPYTGIAGVTEIATALSTNGFSSLPTKDVTAGSNCDVQANN